MLFSLVPTFQWLYAFRKLSHTRRDHCHPHCFQGAYSRGLHARSAQARTPNAACISLSGYEYPERYSRWDIAAVSPPIEIVAAGRDMVFGVLNQRGEMLNRIFEPLLAAHPHWASFGLEGGALVGKLKPLPELFSEEERSKQPSAFSILRTLIDEFQHPLASRLVLLGAFGYDTLFQFDPITGQASARGRKGYPVVPL